MDIETEAEGQPQGHDAIIKESSFIIFDNTSRCILDHP